MPSLWTHRSKPGRGAVLDTSNALANGLAAFWAFQEGGGAPVELLGRRAATSYSGLTWGSSAAGMAAKVAASNVAFAGIHGFGAPITAIVCATTTNVTASQGWIERSTVNTNWELFIGGGQFKWNGANSNSRAAWTPTGLSANTPIVWGCTDTGPLATLYVNGRSVASGSAGLAPGSGSTPIYLGSFDGSTFQLNGSLIWAALWSRALSATEHAAMASNPWQLFRWYAPLDWVLSQTSGLLFRRTLYDRAGSRGVA